MDFYEELLLILEKVYPPENFSVNQSDQEIIHLTFKQQGIHEVIDLIKALREGTITAKELLGR